MAKFKTTAVVYRTQSRESNKIAAKCISVSSIRDNTLKLFYYFLFLIDLLFLCNVPVGCQYKCTEYKSIEFLRALEARHWLFSATVMNSTVRKTTWIQDAYKVNSLISQELSINQHLEKHVLCFLCDSTFLIALFFC